MSKYARLQEPAEAGAAKASHAAKVHLLARGMEAGHSDRG